MSAPDPQDVPGEGRARRMVRDIVRITGDDVEERRLGVALLYLRQASDAEVSSPKAQLAAKDEELRLMTVNRDNWKSAARLADEASDDAEEQRQKLEAQLAEAREALRAERDKYAARAVECEDWSKRSVQPHNQRTWDLEALVYTNVAGDLGAVLTKLEGR